MKSGILRLLHLRETTEAVGEDMERERARFDRIANSDPTRAVTSYQLFQTPTPIAKRMAELLGPLHDGCRVLEPSAGLGRLYRAVRVRNPLCRVTLVEQSAGCCEELYRQSCGDRGATLIQDDFLTCDLERLGGAPFDRIIMNPPFTRGTDCKHIEHARTLLRHGGRLVSLCYAGVKQREKYENDPRWSWELLPSASFKSEGTRADVAILAYNEV